jgi:hypothetical protein
VAQPREGLAVVAVGGAPAGGGGALRELQRGLAPPSVDPCAGAKRDMVGVSGIVPDGVEAVFVTSADGSATRADVHDNGYAFVLPRARGAIEPRYLVWSAANGTPHVQPLPALAMFARIARCRANATAPIQVTPDFGIAACGGVGGGPIVFAPGPPPAAIPMRPHRPRRVGPGVGAAIPARPLPAAVPAPRPMVLCPALETPPFGPARLLRAPRPLPPRALRRLPAPSAAPVPTAPAPRPAVDPRAP